MERKILCFVCLFIMTLSCQAQNVLGTLIDFESHYFDPSDIVNQNPRNPVDVPTVYLDDYTLTFETSHPEYVLYIKDENETVVYSTVVTSATKEVVLPSTLSGDYEIQLVMGNWCFWGYIML